MLQAEVAHEKRERVGAEEKVGQLSEKVRVLQEVVPAPDVGVGMALEELMEKSSTGVMCRKLLRVSGLSSTGSAKLSGLIQINDRILEVDGVATDGLTMEQLKAKIAGPPTSVVTLKIRRDAWAGTDERSSPMSSPFASLPRSSTPKDMYVQLTRGLWDPSALANLSPTSLPGTSAQLLTCLQHTCVTYFTDIFLLFCSDRRGSGTSSLSTSSEVSSRTWKRVWIRCNICSPSPRCVSNVM
jgi:hypothetical protein